MVESLEQERAAPPPRQLPAAGAGGGPAGAAPPARGGGAADEVVRAMNPALRKVYRAVESWYVRQSQHSIVSHHQLGRILDDVVLDQETDPGSIDKKYG